MVWGGIRARSRGDGVFGECRRADAVGLSGFGGARAFRDGANAEPVLFCWQVHPNPFVDAIQRHSGERLACNFSLGFARMEHGHPRGEAKGTRPSGSIPQVAQALCGPDGLALALAIRLQSVGLIGVSSSPMSCVG